MNRLKKIVSLVIFVPLGIVLIVLAVANRQTVTLALNPFRPEDTVLSLQAPFFIFLLVAVLLGMAIGAIVTWWNEGKHRRRARMEAREAIKWQKSHEQATGISPAKQLASK